MPTKLEDKGARLVEHPHMMGSFNNWIKLLWNNRDIEMKYLPRVMSVCSATLLTTPLKFLEQIFYGNRVNNTAIHPSPIIIIGHWRTGTTHLHNIMCRDKNLGYVTVFQVTAPDFCLIGDKLIKGPVSIVQKMIHPTREIDNIPLSMDNPEEEDVALSNMTPYSYLHMYSFPQRASQFFEKYITHFDKLPQSDIAEWQEKYMMIMRKATIKAKGKRLVTKNCADSARIKALLELIPNAKFIHIYRNPYDVYRSTFHLYKSVTARAQLHDTTVEEVETWVYKFYTQLMKQYFADKALIPAGNLVEVKYEDLEKAPIDQLRKVYETLDLPGFTESEPAFQAYLDSITGYKKNVYKEVNDDIIEKVNKHWSYIFDEWDYEKLQPKNKKVGAPV